MAISAAERGNEAPRIVMASTDTAFAGSIPEIYERFLVPLIFEAYARDLAARVLKTGAQSVLETAAGTGVLTRALAAKLPVPRRIVATDLNQAMLKQAADPAAAGCEDRLATGRCARPPVCGSNVRRRGLPVRRHVFSDKLKACEEARRVLKPGGHFSSTSGTEFPKTSSPMP